VLGPLCTWPAGSVLGDHADRLSPLRAIVGDWAREAGVPFLDLTPALRAVAEGGRLPWFPYDTHWNAAGQRAACDALLDWEPVAALRTE